MKRCPRCGATKPFSEFSPDRHKASGYSSWCKACNAAKSREYYDRTSGEKSRARYQANRESILARTKARYQADPQLRAARAAYQRFRYRNDPAYRASQSSAKRNRAYDPAKERINYMKRHGGIDEWARMYAEQNGLCYLCKQPLPTDGKDVHVDHDHTCCPGGKVTESCSACRRGLAHAWCNQIVGLAGENMDVLRAIIINFEPVSAQARARIAAKPQAAVLGVDARGAVDEPEPMPDLDMPVGTSWPAASGALF